MPKQNQKTGFLVAMMVFCAIFLRVLGKFDILIVPGGIVRSLIYIALYIGWDIICALAAFLIMLNKCRLSQRKKYLPFLLLTCSIGYALIYASGAEWMQLIGGDITAAQCLMFTGILECCIQCGLIQTNTGYKALFEAGSIGAQIVDTDCHTRYASATHRC